MALLISYLKKLSSQPSPGYSDNTLRFATVIAEDVRPEDREPCSDPWRTMSISGNKSAKIYGTNLQEVRAARLMMRTWSVADVGVSLSQWILKAP